MNTLLTRNTQEEIVLNYLQAFSDEDVNAMLQNIHPAIHYERYISGLAETIDNGSKSFRDFLERSAIGMDAKSLELIQLVSESDRVDISFTVITTQPYHARERAMKGYAKFWFMDEQILQLVVELETA